MFALGLGNLFEHFGELVEGLPVVFAKLGDAPLREHKPDHRVQGVIDKVQLFAVASDARDDLTFTLSIARLHLVHHHVDKPDLLLACRRIQEVGPREPQRSYPLANVAPKGPLIEGISWQRVRVLTGILRHHVRASFAVVITCVSLDQYATDRKPASEFKKPPLPRTKREHKANTRNPPLASFPRSVPGRPSSCLRLLAGPALLEHYLHSRFAVRPTTARSA